MSGLFSKTIARLSAKKAPLILHTTYYYLCLESDFSKTDLHYFELLDVHGRSFGRVGEQFKKAAEIEGSCRLRDGTVLNYAGVSGGIYRWKLCAFPYGENAVGGPLVPMQSCAVDHSVIPAGSQLQIEGLPGFWIADDTGGAIKGNRIDLFTGVGKASGAELNRQGFGDMKAVKVTFV